MWGTVKKLPVISVELTFFQVYLIAELFGCPVFLHGGASREVLCPVHPFFFRVMSRSFSSPRGRRDREADRSAHFASPRYENRG